MAAERFMQKGTTKFRYLPTIAASSKIPTAAECASGIDVTKDIAEVSGFNFTNDPISTPDIESTFTGSIPGEDKADSSSLTYYDRKLLANNPAKAAMPKGSTGYLVIFPYGTVASAAATGDECDVWPVQVASVSRGYSAGNEASKNVFMFTISAPPALDKTLIA